MKCIDCGERPAIDDVLMRCQPCHGKKLLRQLDVVVENAHERWRRYPAAFGFADRQAAEAYIAEQQRASDPA